ncbi:hypothetical protein A3Q56_00390, partial [Intoshia linei]
MDYSSFVQQIQNFNNEIDQNPENLGFIKKLFIQQLFKNAQLDRHCHILQRSNEKYEYAFNEATQKISQCIDLCEHNESCSFTEQKNDFKEISTNLHNCIHDLNKKRYEKIESEIFLGNVKNNFIVESTCNKLDDYYYGNFKINVEAVQKLSINLLSLYCQLYSLKNLFYFEFHQNVKIKKDLSNVLANISNLSIIFPSKNLQKLFLTELNYKQEHKEDCKFYAQYTKLKDLKIIKMKNLTTLCNAHKYEISFLEKKNEINENDLITLKSFNKKMLTFVKDSIVKIRNEYNKQFKDVIINKLGKLLNRKDNINEKFKKLKNMYYENGKGINEHFVDFLESYDSFMVKDVINKGIDEFESSRN